MPSSATIVQRLFAYVPDNVMQLVGEYTRQFKALNAWQRIRIGVLCAVAPDGTNNLPDCPFILGVCSSGMGYAASRSNFIGASLIGLAQGGTKLLSYSASSATPYFAGTAGQTFKKQESTVTQIAASTSIYIAPANTGWFKRRTAFYVDITKQPGGAGAYTVTLYGPPSTGILVDFRPDHFLQGLDNQAIPTINGQLYVALASTATSFSEILGPLDTFDLVWTRSAFPLEVSALGASIIYANEYYTDGKAGASDDTFETYADSGTATPIPTGSLNGGAGWAGAIYVAGSYSNPQYQAGYSGTSSGFPDDPFEQYPVSGTASPIVNNVLNAGTGWGSAIYVAGSYSNPQYQTGYSGTSSGFPVDDFEQYITNASVYNGTVLSGGTGWSSVAVMGGSYSNLGPQIGYSGTSAGFPDDTFENYAAGAVTSGVTINAGTGWQGVAYVYP